MERDARGFLWDVRESADAILRFIAGRSSDDYLGDEMLRAAVERHFGIIGEALNQLSKITPELAARIPDLAEAIALRNRLIHGYGTIDDATVWRIANEDLPALRQAVAAVLSGMESPR